MKMTSIKDRGKQTKESGINPDLALQSLCQAMHTWLWDIEKYSDNKSSSFEIYKSYFWFFHYKK
jgi:hypothetical protein